MHYVEQPWKTTATKESRGREWVSSSPFRAIRRWICPTVQHKGWQMKLWNKSETKYQMELCCSWKRACPNEPSSCWRKTSAGPDCHSATFSAIRYLWSMPFLLFLKPHSTWGSIHQQSGFVIITPYCRNSVMVVNIALSLRWRSFWREWAYEPDFFFKKKRMKKKIHLIIRTKYISYYAIVDMRANNRTELESKQKTAHNLFSLIWKQINPCSKGISGIQATGRTCPRL